MANGNNSKTNAEMRCGCELRWENTHILKLNINDSIRRYNERYIWFARL